MESEECKAKVKQVCEKLQKAFCTHPEHFGEKYFQHLLFTAYLAARFLVAAIVVLIHGLFPFILDQTASGQIQEVNRILQERKAKARTGDV